LNDHELIKVRFLEFKDEKRELSERLASATNADVAGILGHVAIFYRWQADAEKRMIDLGD
jgi:RNA-binding protein